MVLSCMKDRMRFPFNFWSSSRKRMQNEVGSAELSSTRHYDELGSGNDFAADRVIRNDHSSGRKENNNGLTRDNQNASTYRSLNGSTRTRKVGNKTLVNGTTEVFLPKESRRPARKTFHARTELENQRSEMERRKYEESLLRSKSAIDNRPESDYSKSFLTHPSQAEMLYAGVIGSSIGSYSSTQLVSTVAADLRAVDDDIFKNFDFPFENLVFEGGGNKGMAYVGALRVLEEAGITRKVKRVCGSSVGAITASLVAVGFTSEDLREFCDGDLRKILTDHRCGYCSLLPNLLTGFGWNPGRKLVKWFGEQLKERTGDADITFKEVLQLYGRELCIVVTNLSLMSTEYFHPKTTPNTPIRTAVRMSTALPGIFQSVLYKMNADQADVYVDGGLLCNYPIHAFDGWWLSLDPKDSFFKRLQPLDNYAKLFSKNERFGTWNHRTLGIMLYSHTETELMKAELASRPGNQPPPPPNSKLYRKRRKLRIRQQEAQEEHQAIVTAVGRFMKELHRLHFDLDGVVSLNELKKVFEMSEDFSEEDKILLFGDVDFGVAFEELDRDNDGEITFQELMSFIEKRGVNLQTRFLGYTRKEIKSLGDFLSTLQTALAINVKRNYVEDRDVDRTIGIDTDYIETSDFFLENVDKEFLLESGARAARAFLRDYSMKHPEMRRRGSAMLSKAFFESPRFKNKFQVDDSALSIQRASMDSTLNAKNNTLLPPNTTDSVESSQTSGILESVRKRSVQVAPMQTTVDVHRDSPERGAHSSAAAIDEKVEKRPGTPDSVATTNTSSESSGSTSYTTGKSSTDDTVSEIGLVSVAPAGR